MASTDSLDSIPGTEPNSREAPRDLELRKKMRIVRCTAQVRVLSLQNDHRCPDIDHPCQDSEVSSNMSNEDSEGDDTQTRYSDDERERQDSSAARRAKVLVPDTPPHAEPPDLIEGEVRKPCAQHDL